MDFPRYPRLPELTPRTEGESAQAYGLRALGFVTATGVTATVDREGLQLADHVFPLAISGPDLLVVAAERLADVRALICATLRARDAEQAAPQAPKPQPQPAGVDTPRMGPGAPLTPAPVAPTAPAAALQATSDMLRDPRRIAAALTVPKPPVRPVARPVPAAPQVPADQWGF